MYVLSFRTFYQTLSEWFPLCKVQAGHQLQARHKIRCLLDPGHGMTRTQFQCWFHLCIYYKVHYRFFIRGAGVTRIIGCSRPPGGGWADSKAVHSMECRGAALALLEDSLSVGAAACDALHCKRWEVYYQTSSSNYPTKNQNNRLTPGPVPRWYI